MPALVFGLQDHPTVRAEEVWTWRSCCTTVSAGPTRHRSAMSSFHDTTRLGVRTAFFERFRGLRGIPFRGRIHPPTPSGYRLLHLSSAEINPWRSNQFGLKTKSANRDLALTADFMLLGTVFSSSGNASRSPSAFPSCRGFISFPL